MMKLMKQIVLILLFSFVSTYIFAQAVTRIANPDGKLISNTNQFPVTSQGTDTIVSANSTTTTLASNATFTGSWVSTLGYGYVAGQVISDVQSATGGLKVQFSTDGVNADYASNQDYDSADAGIGHPFTVPCRGQYFRVVYTNGATPQSYFRLQTVLKQGTNTAAIVDIEETIVNHRQAALSKSVIVGQTTAGGGGYVNVKVNPSGALTVENTPATSISTTAENAVLANQSNGTQKAQPWNVPIVSSGTFTGLSSFVTATVTGYSTAVIVTSATATYTLAVRISHDGTTYSTGSAALYGFDGLVFNQRNRTPSSGVSILYVPVGAAMNIQAYPSSFTSGVETISIYSTNTTIPYTTINPIVIGPTTPSDYQTNPTQSITSGSLLSYWTGTSWVRAIGDATSGAKTQLSLMSTVSNTATNISSLGNYNGKTIKGLYGSITPTATTANQLVTGAVYTATAGKVFYVQGWNAQSTLSTLVSSTTYTVFGTVSISTSNGSFTSTARLTGVNSADSKDYEYAEPIPIPGGVGVWCAVTPNTLTSKIWDCNLWGYEK